MTGQDVRWGAASVLLVLAARLPFLGAPPRPDEGGYLMVARQWHLGDPTLYGRYWVDRPPLLLLVFKMAGGVTGLRVLGVVTCLLLVAAAITTGRVLAGPRGGRWAGIAAAALCCADSLEALEVDGELLAGAFVMTAVAGTVLALAPRRSTVARVVLGLTAGVAGAAAVLMKQNFVDGLVFATVLLVVSATDRRERGRALAVLASGVTGVALVAGVVVGWAASTGPGLRALFYAMYLFRLDAAEVIAAETRAGPQHRLAVLVVVAVVSGLVLVLLAGLVAAGAGLRRGDPASWAFLAMVAIGLFGVGAGGNYFRHYLLELVPAAVVGTALCARGLRRRWVVPLLLAVTVTSTLVGAGATAVLRNQRGSEDTQTTRLADWLRQHSAAGRTAVVAYGHPNLLYEAGMSSPYRYLWSLPIRVRDPHLRLLRATLVGPHAPEWVVAWHALDTGGIDESGRLRQALRQHYRRVATVAKRPVYQRAGPPSHGL